MGKAYFELTLKNCRNIKAVEGGSLRIKTHALNVFYGKNGTGKTTISLALEHLAQNSSSSEKRLCSYKYQQERNEGNAPSASCSKSVGNVFIFNDEWVKDHCFIESNLQKNAYQLYVNDKKVKGLEEKRRSKLSSLERALDGAGALLDSLSKIEKSLGRLTGANTFHASSPVRKAFEKSTPLTVIPAALKPVVKGMSAHDKARWASWHMDSPKPRTPNVCPYCGASDEERLRACRDYDDCHENAEVSKWTTIAKLYEEIGDRLSISNAALLRRVLTSTSAPNSDDMRALAHIVETSRTIREAIEAMRKALTNETCIDAAKLVSCLQEKAKTLAGCDQLFLKTKQGKATEEQRALDAIGKSVKDLRTSQQALNSLSQELVRKVASNIAGHEKEINDFLRECGYNYRIQIRCNASTSEANILLVPRNADLTIDQPDKILSYGERNALALALFMFEAIKDQQGLVVLDDPISSYDYDKRYGILYALFSKKGSCFKRNLSAHTVLVMTHDFLVVSDLIRIPGENMKSACGQFLSCDREGILHAQPLDKEALTPYTQMLYKQISEAAAKPEIIQLVIVRQLCEQLRKSPKEHRTKQATTFDLLSNIVHGRDEEGSMGASKLSARDCAKVRTCQNYVSELTGRPFDYWAAVERYSRCMAELVELYAKATESMDKLTLVRLMLERDRSLDTSNIMKRFSDETCHLGGSYLFQLDGRTYDQVPFYVIDWCDEIANRAREKYFSPSDVDGR